MPLPKLSPLQSRLAASLIASFMLLMLYFTFASPHFAYATNVDSILPEDHNHERLRGPILEVDVDESQFPEIEEYEETFLGYARGIIGRAPQAPTSTTPMDLTNNVPVTANLEQGATNSYTFSKASVFGALSPATSGLPSEIELRGIFVEDPETKENADEATSSEDPEDSLDLEWRVRPRQTSASRTVYISVNVCVQPKAILNTTLDPPPQLQLYVSQSGNNTNPGPSKDSTTQIMKPFDGGAVMYSVNATGDIYIGVYGQATTAYNDVWNTEIAVSIDGYYHGYDAKESNLSILDRDSSSGLLVTEYLTNSKTNSTAYGAWMSSPPPFVVFANHQNDRSTDGLQNSYCGMRLSSITPTTAGNNSDKVQTAITTIGNNQPRQQIYLNGLSSDTTYSVTLAMYGNSTTSGSGVVGGGGRVYSRAIALTTSANTNCAMIFGLSFCDQVAYAVPSNSNTFPNTTSLAAFYDNSTQAQYAFFQKALAQVPCETTPSAQFSLARNCDDCSQAYKEWLCSVSIPRCTDFSAPDSEYWLQKRNMLQAFPNGTTLPPAEQTAANLTLFESRSRNPNIDTVVQPGPYKEILPCEDLCYNIVQSCPAVFGFGCPRPGDIAFNQSYGIKADATRFPEQVNQTTCNLPSQSLFSSQGGKIPPPNPRTFIALVAVMMMLVI